MVSGVARNFRGGEIELQKSTQESGIFQSRSNFSFLLNTKLKGDGGHGTMPPFPKSPTADDFNRINL